MLYMQQTYYNVKLECKRSKRLITGHFVLIHYSGRELIHQHTVFRHNVVGLSGIYRWDDRLDGLLSPSLMVRLNRPHHLIIYVGKYYVTH